MNVTNHASGTQTCRFLSCPTTMVSSMSVVSIARRIQHQSAQRADMAKML